MGTQHRRCAHKDADFPGAQPQGSANATLLEKHWDVIGFSDRTWTWQDWICVVSTRKACVITY